MKKYPNLSRMLTLLLVLAVLLPCISMTAFSQDIPCVEDGCSGKYRNGICSEDAAHYEAAPSEGGVYRISNAGQLYWFASLVNSGANEYDAGDNGDVYNAVLTADITINADLEGEDTLGWTPIGLYTGAREYVRYSGTFDGAGYTIYGLHYDNTAYTGRAAGLFGCLDSNGTVKDLTLADSCINGATEIGGIVSQNYGTVTGCTQSGIVSGTGATGGIVCRNMDGGKVEDCENSGTVSGATTGGIAAENNGSVIACENSGAVSGTSSVGGIVGMNDSIVSDSLNTAAVDGASTHVGGVVGNHVGGEIVGCGNSGDVTGDSDYIGGVAGVCSGADISESFNTGDVTGADKSEAVGGVVGAIDGTNTAKSTIESCYNTGAVTGRGWVGGVAGISGYQKTPQTVEFKGSYNTGAVTGTSYAGAVVGKLSKGTASGIYYLKNAAQNSVSGAAGVTAEQFASGEIAYALNGSASEGDLVWKQTIGTDASPKFEGATVYYDKEKGTYYNEGCTHTPAEAVRENEVPATCTEDGSYESVVYCSVCDEELSRGTVTVPALGHTEEVIPAVAPSCIETGLTEGRKCSVCGKLLIAQEDVPALGHDWHGTGCTRCDATRENPFTDVPENEFYIDPVLWAVDNNITTGTSATTFDPNGQCMRAVVVTFLWRAAGSPEPASNANPFSDVTENDFFYKAVLWAVENGITNGLSTTEFGPYAYCNRAQVVTFLWRAMGKPDSTAAVGFPDVEPGQFYSTAVAWAVENGITNGMGDGTFGVETVCNRAQVVTFLYRTLAK